MTTHQPPPSRLRRLLGSPLFWLLLLPVIAVPTIVAVVSARASSTPDLPVMSDAPTFNLEDQRGQTFTSESLRGHVWIANFIFTRCQVVCPVTTAKMADVQRRLANAPVRFVSFSVDPQYDTPKRMRAYAARFNADQATWSFVRGARRTMKKIVKDGFKIAMGIIGIEDDSETDTANIDQANMVHGEHFVLVDQQLRIRGYYRLDDDKSFAKLVRDARALAR